METVNRLADEVEKTLKQLAHGPQLVFPHYSDPTMEDAKTRKAVLRRHDVMMTIG